jgi:sodium transport system permease protein
MFMAVILTTRPRLSVGLTAPPWWSWPAALLLAVCVLPPLSVLTALILSQFPALRALLELNHPLTRVLQALANHPDANLAGRYLFVLAILPALCEELAFRGFILTGLLRGFRPRTAILLSAFLFSLYQMNVFQLVPHFLLGVVLGLLVVRCGSVLPAMVFHLLYNSLLISAAMFGSASTDLEASPTQLLLSLVCTVLAIGLLYALWRSGPRTGQNAE